MRRLHLAQVNIGRFRAPIDSPIVEGFRTQLDPINALADRSPGFLWRLQTEDGNATAVRPYAGDDLMAIKLSVWDTLEALQQFVYKSHHVHTLRARDKWFEPIETFRTPFPPPDGQDEVERLEAEFCDWASHDTPREA